VWFALLVEWARPGKPFLTPKRPSRRSRCILYAILNPASGNEVAFSPGMFWFAATVLILFLAYLLGEHLTARVRYRKQIERRRKSMIVKFESPLGDSRSSFSKQH
jgi:hypothetical protein